MDIIFPVIATVEESDVNWTAYIIIAVILVIATFFAVRYCLRNGFLCLFCGDTDLKVWDRVPEEEQEPILDYFRDYEKREPDTVAIYVCLECKTVYDDFSGQRGSGEPDYHSGGTLKESRDGFGSRAFCKVCNNMMFSCDKENDNILCNKCDTHYEWKIHEPSGYWFLMPPEGADLLYECIDLCGKA